MDVGGEGGETGNTPNIQDDHQICLYELLNQQGCITTQKILQVGGIACECYESPPNLQVGLCVLHSLPHQSLLEE
jgi:hypothetical protein